MKTKIKNLFTRLGVVPLRAGRSWALPALIAVLSLLPAGRATAQITTTVTNPITGAQKFYRLVQ